ncbi:hypothetical protein BOTCAL_0254g00080 [Botryotinia calthae]|uniref:Uncharacterized protein n=1 Tax=Botryotinia calthae TaxID=38488 RepID=A0A4Y8CZ05_9HELO|nr:hypothetical protein BOTCAL_0254g00080 [Botryotinia calthae]
MASHFHISLMMLNRVAEGGLYRKEHWQDAVLFSPMNSLYGPHTQAGLGSKKQNTFDTPLRSFFASDDVIEQKWYRFRLLVFDFTKRQLTKPGDAHVTFHAILEQVKQLTGDTFVRGLPATNFEMGLCWKPGSLLGVRRRKDLTVLKTMSLDRRGPFPSWSWLGWHNAISIRVEERYRDLGLDPEITCYVLRNSPLRLVRVPRISSDVPGGQIRFHPLQSQQSSPNAISLEDIPEHFPELGIEKLDDTPDDQLIFFWAEVAQFEVSEILTVKHEIPKKHTMGTSIYP